MATRLFSRSLLLTSTKQSISSLLSRSSTVPPPSSSSLSFIRLRPLVAAVSFNLRQLSPAVTGSIRGFSTRQTSSSLNDPSPNWSNRPPKETILLDGCDFEHWLVVMEKPEGDPTRDEIIDSYIKTLASVVGSDDEARMKIYSVSTRHYFAFGALVSEELSYKIKELPKVRWVLPDSYLDVKNKDYGGEPFINGQAVPYDPKYHEEWVRNNARANERNRRNDRPRNFDRSRNFERRRENSMPQNQPAPPHMPNQNMQNPSGNVGGMGGPNMGVPPPPPNMGGPPPPPPNMGGPPPPPNMGGPPPNMGPNMGRQPPSNMGGQPPYNNMGGQPPYNNTGGPPPYNNTGGQPPYNNTGGQPPYNNTGGQPPYNNMGGPPPYNSMGGQPPSNNMGGMPNNVPNMQYRNAPNNGGGPYQSGQVSGPGPNSQFQPRFAPSEAGGNNPYQSQNMPGRDAPPPPLAKYE